MCDLCSEPDDRAHDARADGPGPDRRSVLTGMLALPLVAAGAAASTGLLSPVAASTPAALAGQATPPSIVRRAQWGGDLRPKGPIPAEEVKFLLVHHTSEPGSNYQPGEVVGLLRGIYNFHTGPSKGWPDVAYNFFVDKFGTIYEGRTGSVDGPLRGSATGGNQGYSQLCCFIGDFNAAPPPAPALASMYSLLAWLADRYAVDTTPGATVQFTSLGSNKWPAGSTVRTATISGHRDVSQTECPGNACYQLVRSTFPQQVTARRGATPPTTTTATSTTAAPAPTTTVAPPPPTEAPTTTAATVPTAPTDPGRTTTTAPQRTDGKDIAITTTDDGSATPWPLIAGVAVIGAAAIGGAVTAARRRSKMSPTAGGTSAVHWRTAGGETDPLLEALAASARTAVVHGGDWWDDLVESWSVSATVGATGPTPSAEPDSFLVATDGHRALVRLVGDAVAVATLSDGSTSELTRDGVTKVWLDTATVRITLDGEITEVGADGVS